MPSTERIRFPELRRFSYAERTLILFLLLYPSVAFGFPLILALAGWWFLSARGRSRAEVLLVVLLAALILNPIAQAIAASLTAVRPMKLDLFAFVADSYLGNPAFVLGAFVAQHSWMVYLLQVSYGLLPIAVFLVIAVYVINRSPDLPLLLRAFGLDLLLAPLFYLILPICGPQFAFTHFPRLPENVVPHMIRLAAPPNGMPSVHTATAILILWFARKWRLGTVLGAAYLFLILCSTLASGQHYLIDLLGAIPYIALVLMIAKKWDAAAQRRSERAVAEMAA